MPAIEKTIESLSAKGDSISSDDQIILDTLKSIKESIEKSPDSGIQAKSVLRNTAVAMEAYFIDNNTYISCEDNECSERLSKLKAIPDGIELIINGNSTDFQAWARDSNCLLYTSPSPRD